MYNFDIKEKFLRTVGSKKEMQNYKSLFNSVESMEIDLDKDVAMFSNEELAKYFEEIDYCNISSIKARLGCIRNYSLWFNDNAGHCPVLLDDDDVIALIDFSSLHTKNLFYSIEEILSAVDKDKHTSGDLHAPIFILGWYGFELKECYAIKQDEMSINSKGHLKIKSGKKTVVVDNKRCVDIIREYKETKFYKRSPKSSITRYEANDIYLFRRYEADGAEEVKPINNNLFYPVRAGYDKTTDGKRIAFQEIHLSGEMYRIHKNVQAGMTIEAAVKKENPGFASNRLDDRKKIYERYIKAL